MAKQVAILTPAFGAPGGVTTVAAFLFNAIRKHTTYAPTVVSVSTSARDRGSRRAVDPSTWLTGPTISRRRSGDIWFSHVGAALAELEPARYWPHRTLNRVLGRADVVFVVSGTPAWGYLAKDCGRPVILQSASFVAREREERIRCSSGFSSLWTTAMTHMVSKMEPAALRLAARVFVHNRYAADRVAAEIGVSRVEIAPIGIDVASFRPLARYANDGYLLAVGRMNDPRKNAVFLLNSYALLRASMPGAPKLVIAGESPNAELRSTVAKLGLETHVRFVQNPTCEQLVETYRHASLLLMPSVEEGFGIVAVEAMACGVPVVATRCTGPEEIIDDEETGYLVPLDEEVFAAKVQGALREPSRLRLMAARARAVAVERFSTFAASRPYLNALDAL